MSDPRLDLVRSPIKIPERFQRVSYNGKCYPGAPGIRGVKGGANCQRYAYEFVRAFGYKLPDFRSSDLWQDTAHTELAKRPKPFDLVLVHKAPDPWGAHVGVYLGRGLVLHLSKKIGEPAIESTVRANSFPSVQKPAYRPKFILSMRFGEKVQVLL